MRRVLFYILFFTIIAGCQNNQPKQNGAVVQLHEENKVQIDSTLRNVHNMILDGNDVIVHDRIEELVVLTPQNDTLLTYSDQFYIGIGIEDVNHDGRDEIQVILSSNVGGMHEIFMWNGEEFKKIKDFKNIPNYKKIEGENLYYSYYKNGCADSDWGSDLFTVVDFQAIRLGYISGRGCEDQETGIFIYKTENDESHLVQKELREPGYYDDKYDYIDKYWNRNYSLFAKNN